MLLPEREHHDLRLQRGTCSITIMSSLAQEESRSISENVTWGQRKRFSDGKVSIPYGQFLSYRKGADGLPEIVPEEAEIVKRIYREFLQGEIHQCHCHRADGGGHPHPRKKDRLAESHRGEHPAE